MNKEEILNILKYARSTNVLNLSGRELEELPAEIGELTHLTRLNLKHNRLKNLPPEIGRLINLRELWLDGNQLSALPPEIGKMRNLRWLSLNDNDLQELPGDIAELNKLEILELRGNKSLLLPTENLSRLPEELIDYVLTQQEKRLINEIKVMVLGKCGVGKTSLLRRLLERTFDRFEKSTRGVHIQRWPLQVDHKRVLLNIWDFGRSEIENAVHRLFMSPRGIYLLVWDALDETGNGELENWLNLIRFFGENSPVIIAVTKTDLGIRELNRRELLRNYPNIKEFINVSPKSGAGIHELRDSLRKTVAAHENTRAKWPPGWVNIKTRIEISQQSSMELQEFHHICDREGVDHSNRNELLSLLNDLGVATYFFNDFRLANYLILQPEWISNAVNQIMSVKSQAINQGVLTAAEIRNILVENNFPLRYHLFFIDLLKRFELCFDLEDNTDTAYLFPKWMTADAPRIRWEFHDSLVMQYQYSFLPPNLIAKLVARVYPFLLNNTFWQDGFILSDGTNSALVTMNRQKNNITFYVVGRKNTRRDFLAKMRYSFDYLHALFPGLAVSEKVPLLDYPRVILDYQHLLKLEEKGEERIFPEGADEPVSLSHLLNGRNGTKRQLRKKTSELLKQFEKMNARIEEFWLSYAMESDTHKLPRIEKEIKKSETEREHILDELRETKKTLEQL